jgi:hypothetical protein
MCFLSFLTFPIQLFLAGAGVFISMDEREGYLRPAVKSMMTSKTADLQRRLESRWATLSVQIHRGLRLKQNSGKISTSNYNAWVQIKKT